MDERILESKKKKEVEDELGIHTGVTHSRTAVGFEREQKGDGSGDSRDADGLDGGSDDSHWRRSVVFMIRSCRWTGWRYQRFR